MTTAGAGDLQALGAGNHGRGFPSTVSFGGVAWLCHTPAELGASRHDLAYLAFDRLSLDGVDVLKSFVQAHGAPEILRHRLRSKPRLRGAGRSQAVPPDQVFVSRLARALRVV